ncbi:MAG TPA: hypothetical protein VFT31_01805 [Kribbella sp.]|nr:hypothetical protein [Kribbella sp.]
MSQDLHDQHARAMSLPYGRARSAQLEEVVRRAEAEGAADIAFAARLNLIGAYLHGGEPRKSLVPFTRCVTDFDADPARYGDHQWKLLWHFKSVPSTLTKFPEVPLERAYAVLDDMERRWLQGGHSLHAVHQYRWAVASHIGDTATAEEQFRLWSTAPRDQLSDCIGCDPTDKVVHLVSTDRPADAVALGHRVLGEQLDCTEQPQQILTALLPAYVAEGMYAEAVDAHRRAYRLVRGKPGELYSVADHIRFCALTGNEPRAVELTEHHLGSLDDPPSTLAEMEFTAAAAMALRRLSQTAGADVAVRGPGGAEVAAAQLAEEFAARARRLAERFDERNGTDHQGRRIQRLLSEEPWTDYLPLSETARRAQLRRLGQQPASSPDDKLPQAMVAGTSPGDLLDQAEEAWFQGDVDLAAAAREAFEKQVPLAERTELQSARLLEARGLALTREDVEQALAVWREALEKYALLGDEVRVARTRGRLGRLLCERGHLDEGLATGEEPLRWLIDHDEPRRRSNWRFSLAVMLYVTGRHDEAMEQLATVRAEPAGDRDLLNAAALLHGDLLATHGRLEEGESATADALRSEHPLQRSAAYRQRGQIRLALERPQEAIDDLAEAVVLAADPDHRLQAALCKVDLAAAYLQADRVLDAAETAEEALTDLTDPDLAALTGRARQILAQAYSALNEFDAALGQVRILIAVSSPAEDPAWYAALREEEGKLLERLDRDSEAVEPLTDAAGLYLAADRPYDQLVALRRAGRSAMYAGDFEEARALFGQARAVVDSLPADDPRTTFHDAGLWYNLAEIAIRTNDRSNAVDQMTRAAELYERSGHDDQAIDAYLIRTSWGGTADESKLRSIHGEVPPGSDYWYRAGWLLVDLLREQNRDDQADALEAELTQE